WSAEFAPGYKAPGKWKVLAEVYPDYFAGPANYAGSLLLENRFAEAKGYAEATAAPQNALRAIGVDYLGRAALGREQYGEAAKAFDRALALGLQSTGRRRAAVAAAQSRFDEAASLLAKKGEQTPVQHLERIALAVDQGAFARAQENAQKAWSDADAGLLKRIFGLARAQVLLLSGKTAEASRLLEATQLESLAAFASDDAADRSDDAYIALACAYLAQRTGDKAMARRALDALGSSKDIFEQPKVAELAEIVRAGQERVGGNPSAAIVRLRRLVTGNELYQAHVALLDAYVAADQPAAALAETRWLMSHRGLAYIEMAGGQALQASSVADTRLGRLHAAEQLMKLGRSDEARREAQAFLKAWPYAGLPDYLRDRTAVILPASKQ
ncbi:MAG: hypothetical protein ABWX93_06895, partial [Pseudoxanthomonas sp.]